MLRNAFVLQNSDFDAEYIVVMAKISAPCDFVTTGKLTLNRVCVCLNLSMEVQSSGSNVTR